MQFIINTKAFSEYVTPVANIALKNALKDYSLAGMIRICSFPNMLEIHSDGGGASITVKIRQLSWPILVVLELYPHFSEKSFRTCCKVKVVALISNQQTDRWGCCD